MCRLAAFPPGTSPDQAHEIVSNFLGGNDDGVGEAYVREGQFVINKYPYSYKEALSKKDTLFKHMPYAGWTVAHVRLATHGGNEYKNTHPVVKGNVAVVHNGVFNQANIIRCAMADSVKWSGDTDTEVAAYMLNKLGPELFYKAMDKYAHSPGVFLALDRGGGLTAVKIGGDLEILRTSKDTFMLASAYPWQEMYRKSRDVDNGVLKLDAEGHASNFKFEKDFSEKKDWWSPGTRNGYGNYNRGACNTYTQSGISQPNTSPTTSSPPAKEKGTGVVQKPADTVKKKKTLELWSNWPTEDDLSSLEFE